MRAKSVQEEGKHQYWFVIICNDVNVKVNSTLDLTPKEEELSPAL